MTALVSGSTFNIALQHGHVISNSSDIGFPIGELYVSQPWLTSRIQRNQAQLATILSENLIPWLFPCPHLSAGEIRLKYRHSALDETANEPPVRKEPIYLFPPCLRASVVQRSCLWLRLRRAAFQVLLLVFAVAVVYKSLPIRED